MEVVKRAWREVISDFRVIAHEMESRRNMCHLWVPLGSVEVESRLGGWKSQGNEPKRTGIYNGHLKCVLWFYSPVNFSR